MAKKELVRLQKMMADCGVASRRKSEDLIRQGSVKVNGRVAVIGDKVDPVMIRFLLRVKESRVLQCLRKDILCYTNPVVMLQL